LEDAHGEPRTALILGGTSEIALAIARRLIGGRLREVVLAVRSPDGDTTVEARELLERAGATSVRLVAFDAAEPDTHVDVVQQAVDALGDLDLVIVAHGQLGDHEALVADPAASPRVETGCSWDCL